MYSAVPALHFKVRVGLSLAPHFQEVVTKQKTCSGSDLHLLWILVKKQLCHTFAFQDRLFDLGENVCYRYAKRGDERIRRFPEFDATVDLGSEPQKRRLMGHFDDVWKTSIAFYVGTSSGKGLDFVRERGYWIQLLVSHDQKHLALEIEPPFAVTGSWNQDKLPTVRHVYELYLKRMHCVWPGMKDANIMPSSKTITKKKWERLQKVLCYLIDVSIVAFGDKAVHVTTYWHKPRLLRCMTTLKGLCNNDL